MKTLAKLILRLLAARIVKINRPVVIGITGSVGKTSIKEISVAILKKFANTRGNASSYNTEFGLPLTIIGEKSGGGSVANWLFIFIKAFKLAFFRSYDYPKILVLEMGADKPGDIEYLLKIVKPDIAVLTAVSETHLQNFKNIKSVLQEKQKLLLSLPKNGTAIINADDELAYSVKDKLNCNIIEYGFESNGIKIIEPRVTFSVESQYMPTGMQFKLERLGSMVPMAVYGVVGNSIVSSCAAGIAVALAAGMNLVDASRALEHFVAPPGRMRILQGIKNTCIIDDCYNSSPKAAKAALTTFSALRIPEDAEKWVVLGDMRELGKSTEQLHIELGDFAAKSGIDHLVTIGEYAKDIANGALMAGFNEERIYKFAEPDAAKNFIKQKIRKNDIILIKGSRAVHLEKIVEEILQDPLKASSLIVQSY